MYVHKTENVYDYKNLEHISIYMAIKSITRVRL